MTKLLGPVFFLSTLFLGCGPLPKLGPPTETKLASAAEEDCGFVQNSYGQRVSWKQSLPVKFYIDPTYPTEYVSVLRDAARKWEDILGRTLFVFEKSPQVSSPGKDNRNIIYWQNPWTDENKNLQAMTMLHWKGNSFVESDIRVDDQYFTYYVTHPNGSFDVHLESLLVHELGHVLGLKHLSGKPSVMWSVLDYLVQRNKPSAADVANLKCEYK